MLELLKGHLVSAPRLGALDIVENGYLALEDGVVRGVFPCLPEQYRGAPVADFGNRLILQSFADMHLHGAQYPMLGLGMDVPLLDWLSQYAFPLEARFADTGFAREVYPALARALVDNGTTRVCMFSSLHTDATLVLMEALEQAGITGYVGKVNMDRNGGENLQETTEESQRETLRWLDACDGFRHIRPMLTPRFAAVTLGQPCDVHAVLEPVLSDERIMGVNLYAVGLGETVEARFAELITGPGAVRAALHRHVSAA